MASTNNLSPIKARLARRTRTTKKVFGNKEAKKFVAMTFLHQVLMLISSRMKKRIFPKSSTSTITRKRIMPSIVSRKKTKNLMSVLATFMLVTAAKKEAIEAVETAEANENGKESKSDEKSKGGEYPRNLARVLCIQ